MSNSKKDQQVVVPGITVDKNVIVYGNSFICVDNISLITISQIPSNRSWIAATIMGLLGMYLKSQYFDFGAYMLVIAIIWFIIVCIYNSNRGENLAISLNSGNTLYFNCKDRSFLNKVVDTIIQSIKGQNKATYSINFEKCKITGGVMNNSNFVEV